MSEPEYHFANVTDDMNDPRWGDSAVHDGPPHTSCARCVIVNGYPIDIEGVGGIDE